MSALQAAKASTYNHRADLRQIVFKSKCSQFVQENDILIKKQIYKIKNKIIFFESLSINETFNFFFIFLISRFISNLLFFLNLFNLIKSIDQCGQ